MLKSLALVALTVSATAPAQQVTSYRTDNPAPTKGDDNKIVCQKEETIGTRLGAKKVCLTVAEWRQVREAARDGTERIQALSCMPGEGQGCIDPN